LVQETFAMKLLAKSTAYKPSIYTKRLEVQYLTIRF